MAQRYGLIRVSNLKGSTLIEVLLSLTIFSTVTLGVLCSMLKSLQSSRTTFHESVLFQEELAQNASISIES